MYFNEKNILLCGLDHGFSTMKTTHAIFDNGVEQLGGKATLSNNTLVYNGKNYKVGEGRLPMMKTKTEDKSYFLLTLAGVAKELDMYHKQSADVILAVGLPFSRFGQEKQEFRDYLYRKGEIFFRYSGRDYEICICKCQYKNVVFLSYKHVGKPTCLYDIFSYPQSYIASDPLVGTKVHLY